MENTMVINKPATLPAKTGKAFKGLTVESFIQGVYPYEADERATPSLVKMTRHASIAALGGEASPQSLINGMLYVVSAHAFGQLDFSSLKLPTHSAHAVKIACGLIAKGKGATCGNVRASVISGVNAMLALPARTVAVTQKKAPALSAPVAENEAPRNYLLADSMLTNPAMDADTQQERYSGFYLRQSQAQTTARNESPEYKVDCEKMSQAEWIAAKAEEKAMEAIQNVQIARVEFRRLAELLQIKLTVGQLKTLAA